MTLVLEDGTGVPSANAYATIAFVDTYLTDRDRETENTWSSRADAVKDGAVVQATDFIERRWGARFLGNRQFQDVSAARGTLTLTGQPSNTETVTIGATVYTFNTALGGARSILIGASTTASIKNLVDAVNAVASQEGVTHGTGTVLHATVTANEGVGDTLRATAKAKGTAANTIATTDTVTNGSWSAATLLGGSDVALPQALSFPRGNLFDGEGLTVGGVPLRLQQATAEYAVRSLAALLMPDPTVDATGRAVTGKVEQVGPIKEETRYTLGSAVDTLIHPYPAADRLLAEYVISGGSRVIRG